MTPPLEDEEVKSESEETIAGIVKINPLKKKEQD